jgi:hypothetical protein
MLSCSELLEEYSDYRDGLVSASKAGQIRAHLDGCQACARYDRVVSGGVRALRALPEIEPSDDFLPRLQHRLYHIDEELAAGGARAGSGVSLQFVLLLVCLIAAAAWLPMVMARPALVELPPVAARQPVRVQELPPLFRSGPLLGAGPVEGATLSRSNDLFFRYSPVGSRAAIRTASLSAPR